MKTFFFVVVENIKREIKEEQRLPQPKRTRRNHKQLPRTPLLSAICSYTIHVSRWTYRCDINIFALDMHAQSIPWGRMFKSV